MRGVRWLSILSAAGLLAPACAPRPAWCPPDVPLADCPACDPAQVGQPCYDGPPGSAGIGRCGEGLLACIEESGRLYCEGQILPDLEDPATPEVDDDCDGRLDEGLSITCGDCAGEISIALARLAERGPRHRVAVRLTRSPLPPGDAVARRTEAQLRASALDALLVERGLPALEAVRPLSFSGFTATASTEALALLIDQPDVAGIVADYTLPSQLVEGADLIGAPAARRRSGVDGRGIRVAIIDSGLDYTHPAFGGCAAPAAAGCRVVDGWDALDGDPDPMDESGHGTHLAGIVAGGRGGPGGPGIAPGAELVPIRAGGAGGIGYLALIEALDDLIARPDLEVRVALVGAGSAATYSALACGRHDRQNAEDQNAGLIRAAVAELRAQGVLVVFPAGNGGDPYAMSYPACLSGVFAVGGVYDAHLDEPATYALDADPGQPPGACTDPAPRRDQVPCFANGEPVDLDLVAPAAPIEAAAAGGGTRIAAGTSAAAAHVAGAAALLFEDDPARTPDDVAALFRRTAALSRERRPDPTRPLYEDGYAVFRLNLANLIDRRCLDDDDDGHGVAGPDCDGPPDCRDDDPTRYPGAVERCDGVDDDCDGAVDEGFELGQACDGGVGQCAAAGVWICDGDGGRRCDAEVGEPVAEACNGLDDDCDGATDEDLGGRTVTSFRTGEDCCDAWQDDGVSAGEPPRAGGWFDLAEGESVRVRVRFASDGHVGCAPCADCPDDCDDHEIRICDDPDRQDDERLKVWIEDANGGRVGGWETEDANGGGGGDWRSGEQQCRQRTEAFPEVTPGAGRYRLMVGHVNDDGGSNSVKLQTSRVEIRCR